MTNAETEEKIASLGVWFHNLRLNGAETAPHHFLGDYPAVKWRSFEHAVPADLSGMSVLDIGCNGGFYSIQMKLRGARRVVAIDHDDTYLAQARFAADVLELEIFFQNLSVYDLWRLEESFDIVLFMGVFYHLRHPLLALDLIRQHVAKDWLIFQSMLRGSSTSEVLDDDYSFEERALFDKPGFPKLHFVERSYSKDPTNWFIPNKEGAAALLRSSGFHIVEVPEPEVFICRTQALTQLHPLPSLLAEVGTLKPSSPIGSNNTHD